MRIIKSWRQDSPPPPRPFKLFLQTNNIVGRFGRLIGRSAACLSLYRFTGAHKNWPGKQKCVVILFANLSKIEPELPVVTVTLAPVVLVLVAYFLDSAVNPPSHTVITLSYSKWCSKLRLASSQWTRALLRHACNLIQPSLCDNHRQPKLGGLGSSFA